MTLDQGDHYGQGAVIMTERNVQWIFCELIAGVGIEAINPEFFEGCHEARLSQTSQLVLTSCRTAYGFSPHARASTHQCFCS